ncbi:MAG: hypothetical protein AMXMBFR33_34230 [Candidatus Xenobia bacterium]
MAVSSTQLRVGAWQNVQSPVTTLIPRPWHNLTMLAIQPPCSERLPARFDFAPIDTCEEAMFAPGADMLVRALVGDEAHVRVSFEALGHQIEYVQDREGVEGTIDGKPFTMTRTLIAEGFTVGGDTPAGEIQVSLREQPGNKAVVEGHAGRMGFRHELERRDPSTGKIAIINGKFD